MKNIVFKISILGLLLHYALPIHSQLKVRNSNGHVTVGSTDNAAEELEVYGDAQIFDESPFMRFKLSTPTDPGSQGGLHWRDAISSTPDMRLYYDWNWKALIIGPTNDVQDNYFIVDNVTGFVGIGGTANPHKELDLRGDMAISGEIIGISDFRVKKNIINLESALSKVLGLNPVQYFYKTKEYDELKLPTNLQYGFIAQEFENVYPSLVTEHSTIAVEEQEQILKGIDYIKLIPILTKAIQEQQVLIEDLQKRLRN